MFLLMSFTEGKVRAPAAATALIERLGNN